MKNYTIFVRKDLFSADFYKIENASEQQYLQLISDAKQVKTSTIIVRNKTTSIYTGKFLMNVAKEI
jgi:ribosomal protein L27